MWVCEEVSQVCIHCHLDQKSQILKNYAINFLEREKGREKDRKRNIEWLPLICTPTGD